MSTRPSRSLLYGGPPSSRALARLLGWEDRPRTPQDPDVWKLIGQLAHALDYGCRLPALGDPRPYTLGDLRRDIVEIRVLGGTDGKRSLDEFLAIVVREHPHAGGLVRSGLSSSDGEERKLALSMLPHVPGAQERTPNLRTWSSTVVPPAPPAGARKPSRANPRPGVGFDR